MTHPAPQSRGRVWHRLLGQLGGGLRTFAWPIVLLIAVLLVGLLKEPAGPPNSFDLRSADSRGARALALYLGQSGWRTTDQVTDPDSLRPADSVLLLTPETTALLDAPAARRLEDWVTHGGRLVLLGGAPVGRGPAGRDPLGGDPEKRNIFAYAPPLTLPGRSGPAAVSGDDPRLAGVRQVVTQGGVRWDTTGDAVDNWRGVLSNIDGTLVLVRRGTGQGEVVALADASPLSNHYLPEGDNLALALALVGDGQRHQIGVYAIDPMAYLRGRLAGQGPVPLPLSWRLLPWGLALAAALGFWRSGRRTGPVLPPAPPPARPATEFLQAQAHAYRRARANAAVLRYVFDAFRRDLARRAGLPPQASLPALAAAAPRLGVAPAELSTLLERVERFLARPLTEKHMLTLVRDLVVMQRRMGHARG